MSTTPSPFKLAVESLKEMNGSIIFGNDSPNETELVFGDNFEIQVKDGKTYVVRKQPQYPKTYEECCKVLGSDPSRIIVLSNCKDIIHEENKHCYEMYNIYQLLICRDAYWKMAGDWKYDVNKAEEYFYIVNKCGRVVKEHYMNFNHILAFPTKEMRDAFYDNFKELIEECKELL